MELASCYTSGAKILRWLQYFFFAILCSRMFNIRGMSDCLFVWKNLRTTEQALIFILEMFMKMC